ncbi:MAG: DUF4157 domain-containing protein [Candidatus Methanoperedens sp.]|nr:DUF4157 domain-containing protein [Candidatus Methanoperedens sp.]
MPERTSANRTGEAKRENSAPSQQKIENPISRSTSADRILLFQRTVGNQSVQKLIISGAMQAKLRTNQPGDMYEQEADRVAEQVMRMPQVSGSNIASGNLQSDIIQRKCPGCTGKPHSQPVKEDEGMMLQSKEVTGHTLGVKPDTEAQINAISGGGQPLPESVRTFYEPRFGHDFSQVRVHADAKAAEAARAVNARAFTVGRDVVFGEGEYAPGISKGRGYWRMS